jgi:hypothetical protein
MAKDDALYRRALSKSKWAQKQKAKKQGQTNVNLGRQWETSLSRQYDNDGNPRTQEVQWSTPGPFVGH